MDFTGIPVDFPGTSVDISCITVDFSGNTVDLPGIPVDFSGSSVDFRSSSVDFSGFQADSPFIPVFPGIQIARLYSLFFSVFQWISLHSSVFRRLSIAFPRYFCEFLWHSS